jgi:hypothetical protein
MAKAPEQGDVLRGEDTHALRREPELLKGTVRLAVGPVRSTQSRVVQPAAKPVQGGGTQAWRVLGAGP